MPEQSLFSFDRTDGGVREIKITDAELSLRERAFSADESDRYLDALIHRTPWRRDVMKIHGKSIPIPRLQAWYADDGAALHYSGMTVEPLDWTDELLAIRQRVYALTGLRFNGVLLNYYRDGNDSVGWHSDNESEFGRNPIIASVSFGATRDFILKHLFRTDVPALKCPLTHGCLLVMGDGVQTHWQHQLPKRKRISDPRINLTFRNIVAARDQRLQR